LIDDSAPDPAGGDYDAPPDLVGFLTMRAFGSLDNSPLRYQLENSGNVIRAWTTSGAPLIGLDICIAVVSFSHWLKQLRTLSQLVFFVFQLTHVKAPNGKIELLLGSWDAESVTSQDSDLGRCDYVSHSQVKKWRYFTCPVFASIKFSVSLNLPYDLTMITVHNSNKTIQKYLHTRIYPRPNYSGVQSGRGAYSGLLHRPLPTSGNISESVLTWQSVVLALRRICFDTMRLQTDAAVHKTLHVCNCYVCSGLYGET